VDNQWADSVKNIATRSGKSGAGRSIWGPQSSSSSSHAACIVHASRCSRHYTDAIVALEWRESLLPGSIDEGQCPAHLEASVS